MAMIGCRACGKTIKEGTVQCPHCGVNLATYVPPAVLDEFALMSSMTDAQRLLFQQQLNAVRKDGTTGVILALLLGGLGIHHFYMGNMLAGVVYILFCWTFIPAILGVIEAFLMPSRVRDYNRQQANLIASQIKVFAAAAS